MATAKISLNNLTDPVVATLLKSGEVSVLPTDTLYGLAVCADNKIAVGRLYKIKARENKPGTLIAADLEQLVEFGLKRRYLKAVERYWPGAVSIIIPCGGELSYLHLGLGGLAVRISDDRKLNTLIKQTGVLLTTSANKPGAPPANTINEAEKYFNNAVDFYVDGGDLSGRQPSTVIRIIDDAVEVIRQGSVKIEDNTGEIKR